MLASSDLELGKAAEHLVVADLILQGYRAFLADQGLPYDVLVDVGGRIFKVQVKATRKLHAVAQRRTELLAYHFFVKRAGKGGKRLYGADEFDLVALVALDCRVIAYLPIAEVANKTIHLRPAGYVPVGANTRRRENIDQFGFDRALRRFLAA